MTRTEELLALAEAAIEENGNNDGQWYIPESLDVVSQGFIDGADATFIAACDPETIKHLVELVRLQHAALIELSPCMHEECCQLQNQTQDQAIAAFNKFEQGGE